MLEAGSGRVEVPNRGVVVQLPPQAMERVVIEATAGVVGLSGTQEGSFGEAKPINWEGRVRLDAIMQDRTLKERYPRASIGRRFMGEVDYDWREYYFDQALNLTAEIKDACEMVGVKRFAVVLYGSVARDLVKRPGHPDPSNIDLVVTGDMNCAQKTDIYDLIREPRERITTEIIEREEYELGKWGTEAVQVPKVNLANVGIDGADSMSRAGVFIQPVGTIEGHDFDLARWYMAGCGQPLYDPVGLWAEVEYKALPYLALSTMRHDHAKRIKQGKEVRGLDPVLQRRFQEVFPLNGRVYSIPAVQAVPF